MKQPRVFVVDDDADFVRLVTLTLSGHFGYEVLAETDSMLAVERIKTERPDVIFLDLKMPRQDGFETLKFLLADEDTCDIPVIILSNLDADRFQVTAERWGATAFLGKKALNLAAFVNAKDKPGSLLIVGKADLDNCLLDQAIKKVIAQGDSKF
jgi:CheY-like chemotaxis protein